MIRTLPSQPRDCSKCGKPVEEAYWKYGRLCRACRSKYSIEKYREDPATARRAQARYRAAHPFDNRARSWRSQGILMTLAKYDALVAAQGGECAICRSTKPGGRYRFFHVDHDHQFGHVRGLLCSVCNRALGAFKDSPELLRRAAKYLDTHQPKLAIAGKA